MSLSSFQLFLDQESTLSLIEFFFYGILIIQEIQRTLFETKGPQVPQHPLVLASCFGASSGANQGSHRNCSGNHFSVEGLAKMLAYGDWVRARASRTNSTLSEVLQEDVMKYSYDRKLDLEVRVAAIYIWGSSYYSFPPVWP